MFARWRQQRHEMSWSSGRVVNRQTALKNTDIPWSPHSQKDWQPGEEEEADSLACLPWYTKAVRNRNNTPEKEEAVGTVIPLYCVRTKMAGRAASAVYTKMAGRAASTVYQLPYLTYCFPLTLFLYCPWNQWPGYLCNIQFCLQFTPVAYLAGVHDGEDTSGAEAAETGQYRQQHVVWRWVLSNQHCSAWWLGHLTKHMHDWLSCINYLNRTDWFAASSKLDWFIGIKSLDIQITFLEICKIRWRRKTASKEIWRRIWLDRKACREQHGTDRHQVPAETQTFTQLLCLQ